MVRWILREVAEPPGWNPHSLAVAAQLPYTTVRSIWFNEAQHIDLITLDKLAQVLNVSPGSLIGSGEGNGEAATPPRPMPGICSEPGVSLSTEQIDEARQEMWGRFIGAIDDPTFERAPQGEYELRKTLE